MVSNFGGYRGYCTHNSFGAFRMPVPAQNIIYLEYVKKNNLKLKLSINELDIKGCYLNYKILVSELSKLDGLLFCSSHMLPDQTKLRWLLYNTATDNKAIVHFIFENIICETSKDFRNIEELIICRNEIQREAGIAEKMKRLGVK